jgi:Na+/melibiose symporter-like transporter
MLSEGGLYIALTITIILTILSLFLAFNYAEKVYQYEQKKKEQKFIKIMSFVVFQITNFFFLVILAFEIYELISK